ncbi:MAG: flagellar hook protein FlgE [Chloroflexota bacterium]|jgi:flagellar hook protein FlgE|nr:flagellar hook protein FlgE [Chloroflexota bacterium]
MMRSFFSAISGLRDHQIMMDVVGNNIANVNTTGFKASRVTFQDIISQTLSPAGGPSGTLGGKDPRQVGLGVAPATIDALTTQGNIQATGKPTDFALQGDGYMVLSDDAAAPTISFTRDGNFDLGIGQNATDPRPLLHGATGLHVKGWVPAQAAGTGDSATAPTADITVPVTQGGVAVTGFNVDTTGTISLTLADGTTAANFAQIAIALFPNAGGLNRQGNNLFATTANSGAASYNGGNINGRGQLNAGFLEMSNVDLATQFTNMIIAQRGFQANSRVITTTDQILQDLVDMKR